MPRSRRFRTPLGAAFCSKYKLVFRRDASTTMEFFGSYLEVVPHSRLVWTNEEGDDGQTITTVTFEEKRDQTLLVIHDLYPSKEALDGALASQSTDGMPETLDQLEELIVARAASVGPS
jgi:uncharacterized protein YndB with AHSA1/START domain